VALEDLTSALISDSMETARPLVAGYASLNRRVSGKLYRPTGQRVFERVSQSWTAATRDLLYNGPARIWPVGSSRSIGPEDAPQDVQTARVSIDALPDQRRPQLDDVFVVDDSETARDLQISDQAFLVTGVSTGGQFSYGWHLELIGIAPSPNDPEQP
jgi:hypothetical protein